MQMGPCQVEMRCEECQDKNAKLDLQLMNANVSGLKDIVTMDKMSVNNEDKCLRGKHLTAPSLK